MRKKKCRKIVVEFGLNVSSEELISEFLQELRDFLVERGVTDYRFRSYFGRYKETRCKFCGMVLNQYSSRRIHEPCRGKFRFYIAERVRRYYREHGFYPPENHPLYKWCCLLGTTPRKFLEEVYGKDIFEDNR